MSKAVKVEKVSNDVFVLTMTFDCGSIHPSGKRTITRQELEDIKDEIDYWLDEET